MAHTKFLELYKEICDCWYKILPFFMWNQYIQKGARPNKESVIVSSLEPT